MADAEDSAAAEQGNPPLVKNGTAAAGMPRPFRFPALLAGCLR